MTEELQDNFITIEDEDGNEMTCELYDIIEFEGSQYALLFEANAADVDEAEFVLMRYSEEGEESYFESIDDDDEFERVSNYVESLDDEEFEDEVE